MINFGHELSEAMKRTLRRGQTYWVGNQQWPELFESAESTHHPALVTHRGFRFIPGTSKTLRPSQSPDEFFILEHPESLGGTYSRFFVHARKPIDSGEIGNFKAQIHDQDLNRLNQILGQEPDA